MAKPFRLYVCSDIHASERTWRKFLNAMKANVYKVDAAVIAGDLTGKALIAVVKSEAGDEAWTATVMGQRRVARTEVELEQLERSIADLGYYAVRVSEPERAAMEADPALVKRHFHEQIAGRLRAWMDLAADRLEGSGVPVYLMPGNDDDFEIDPILAEFVVLRERQRARDRPDAVAPAREHGLVVADALVDPARAARRGVPRPSVGAPGRRPRPAQDGDHDPRPAVRFRPRHGAAPVA